MQFSNLTPVIKKGSRGQGFQGPKNKPVIGGQLSAVSKRLKAQREKLMPLVLKG
jgi:hypothetical protein